MKNLFVTILAAAFTFTTWGAELPRETMPDRVYTVLLQAIQAQYEGNESDRGFMANKQGLDAIHAKMAFPNFSQLEFLSLHHRQDSSIVLYAWGRRLDDGGIQIVLDDWMEESFSANNFYEVQAPDFKEEIRKAERIFKDKYENLKKSEVAISAFRRNPNLPLILEDRCWVIWRHLRRSEPWLNDLLFQYAYESAYMDESEIAKICMQLLYLLEPAYLNQRFDLLANRAVDRGKFLLMTKRPFREVYDQWRIARKVYGESQKKKELNALLEDMKPQVMAEIDPSTPKTIEPSTLSLDERIEYYIGQLQETCEHAATDPPFYSLLQKCEPLISIGTPAIDKLIDHLDDRRLTRTVYRDMFFSGEVYRVSSVVSACIQKILGFIPDIGINPVNLNEMDSFQKDYKQKIKEWWAQYRDKKPAEWYLSRLEQTPIAGRVELLKKIEAIDPRAVDSVSLLKKWAAEAETKTEEQEKSEYKAKIETNAEIPPIVKGVLLNSGHYFDDNRLPTLADALAERGDLSLLPQMRIGMQECLKQKQYLYPYVGYLIRYGDGNDYLDLFRRAQQEAKEGFIPGSSNIISPVFSAVESVTNPLAVPILVSFLDRPEEYGAGSMWHGDGQFSMADQSMQVLLRRIPHNEGFKQSDPPAARREAIERWKQWWRREGKAEFLKKYAEAEILLKE